MKNDNTKEKRMQTLPLLYYINKTPFYKLFSIKNLYQIAVCVLKMAGALGFEPRLPPSEGYNGFRDRCSAIELCPDIRKKSGAASTAPTRVRWIFLCFNGGEYFHKHHPPFSLL